MRERERGYCPRWRERERERKREKNRERERERQIERDRERGSRHLWGRRRVGSPFDGPCPPSSFKRERERGPIPIPLENRDRDGFLRERERGSLPLMRGKTESEKGIRPLLIERDGWLPL